MTKDEARIAELEEDLKQAYDSLKHLKEQSDRDKNQLLDTIRHLKESSTDHQAVRTAK